MSVHEHIGGPRPESVGRAFFWGLVLNAGFVVAEFVAGFACDSTGLLADAGHNLGDVGGLLLALGAFWLARKKSCEKYTYGFRKGTILAALGNAILLCVAVGMIVVECVDKFLHPVEVDGWASIIVAGVGVVVNGATVLLFARGRKNDLNVKGAFVHMLADAFVSIGVVVSGVVILATGWTFVDPTIGLIIAFVILISAQDLAKESLCLALDGVPKGLEPEALRRRLANVANVEEVRHLHVWALGVDQNALTAHFVLKDATKWEETKSALRKELNACGVAHSTLELEASETRCDVCA